MNPTLPLAWGAKVSPEFRARLYTLVDHLGWREAQASDLMACMAFETGRRFSPDVRNPGSSACVDTETEILTVYGWKRYDEISVGDEIYSVDVDAWQMERDVIKKVTVKQSSDNYRITSRSFDSLTTSDHRWYLERRDYNHKPHKAAIVEKTTEEITELKSSYLYSVPHPSLDLADKTKKTCQHDHKLLKLIGMIVGDGSISKSRRLIELVCDPVSSPEQYEATIDVVTSVLGKGVHVDQKKSGRLLRWNFNRKYSDLLMPFFDSSYNESLSQSRFVKKINPEVLANLDYEAANALLDGYMITDGHHCKSKNAVSFRNTERKVLDDFMHIAVLAGHNPREVVNSRGGCFHVFPNGRSYEIKDIYTVYLRMHSFTSCNKKQIAVEHVTNELTMWCPTTRNGNWIARRNGTVYITGNCGLLQFMAATAKRLGTTTAALGRMTAVDQLDYVERYLATQASRITGLDDMYMAVLWPAAVGKPADTVLWRRGLAAFAANRGLDVDKNGRITKREASAKVREQLRLGLQPGNVWLPSTPGAKPTSPPTSSSNFES